MTELEKELERWRKYVYGSNSEGHAASPDEYKSTLIHEVWSHRWRWFRPPHWRIFRWAFNIERKVYTGIYPVAIGGDMVMHGTISDSPEANQMSPDDIATQMGVRFTASSYTHPEIEKIVVRSESLAEQMAEYAKKSGIHLCDDSLNSDKKEEDECSGI